MHDEETEEGRIVCKCFSYEPYIISEKSANSICEPFRRSPMPSRLAAGALPVTMFRAGCRILLDQVWGGQPPLQAGPIQLPGYCREEPAMVRIVAVSVREESGEGGR